MTADSIAENEAGEWRWSEEHRSICRIMESDSLWGETICRVWMPGQNIVVRVRAESPRSLAKAESTSPDGIAYVAAVALVANAMSRLPYTRQWHPPSLNDE